MILSEILDEYLPMLFIMIFNFQYFIYDDFVSPIMTLIKVESLFLHLILFPPPIHLFLHFTIWWNCKNLYKLRGLKKKEKYV